MAADRLLLGILLTWLVTPLCAPDTDVELLGWASVTGVPVTRLIASRAAAAGALAVLVTISTAPVVMVAAQIAAAPMTAVMMAVGEMMMFALLAVGLTAASGAVWRHPLAVWCAGMAMTVIAAFGVRLLASGATRFAACGIVAAAGAAAAVGTAQRRWRWLDQVAP